MTKISNIPSVQSVVLIAQAKGINDVFLSPGSRNAPFALSFSAIESFNCISVLDERSAGFIALGMAQQTRKPVILSCTSGSAVINYAPAMVEAFYQKIPLIAVTADRPAEWIDQGEGQSIRQTQLMDGVYVQNFNLVFERDADDHWYNNRLINEAFEVAIEKQQPVQINVPLREPLYNSVDLSEVEKPRIFQKAKLDAAIASMKMSSLLSKWESSEKIMILVGQHESDNGLIDQLRFIADDDRVAILTETTANLFQMGFVSCIDRTIDSFLSSDEEGQFVPDLLVTIGGNLISKKLKSFLRRHASSVNEHWHLGGEVMDTFQSLTQVIDVKPSSFILEMRDARSEKPSDFSRIWKNQFFQMEQKHEQFLAAVPYSDLKVFQHILDWIPDGTQIQMGNSSVVRYIQLFNQLRSVSYFGNRGVSGIEGCVSTAVGAALATKDMVLHISGDHAFRYDSNALALESLPSNLRIIVINNGGGNIFRIIPGPTKHELSEKFIEKAQQGSIQKLVEYHGIEYSKSEKLEELDTALEQLLHPEKQEAAVLEIFTPRIESPEVLKSYFHFLSS